MVALPLFYLAYKHEVDNVLANTLTNSPIHILWAGHEAVLLFFVLSGFVLSLPFLNNRTSTYSNYLIKRFCRIYIPYIVSIILSAILFNIINPSEVNELSSNFNDMWSHPITIGSLISFIFMLGSDVINLNGVTWSLVHEMRISIFFPVIMFFIIKLNWKKGLPLGVGVSLFLWVFFTGVSSVLENSNLQQLAMSFGETFYYTSFFVIGATLAKYKDVLISKTQKISTKSKVLLFIIFIILYLVEWVSFGFGDLKYRDGIIPTRVINLVIDFAIAASVALLFILTLSFKKLNNALNNKHLVNLGKISYSLYLIHMIVLLVMVHTLIGHVPTILILVLSPIASVILAVPFYYCVERSAIQIGKKLTSGQVKSKNLVKSVNK
jgi:peptidoglycan/LPS O-acetylase OafA/YrhL